MESSLERLFVQGIAELGIDLGKNEVKLYFDYMESLLEWNERINLTAITDPEEIIIKHYLDSLSVLRYLPVQDGARLLDVGTGPGIPGIPLKIALPRTDMVLLDSLNKRVVFLNHVISKLGLSGIVAVHGRAEEMARRESWRGVFDVVVSRAVAKLPVLVEICIPFLKTGGVLVAYKGPQADEEINQAHRALEIMKSEVTARKEIILPVLGEKRVLVFIKKLGPTPEKYPRKAGLPEKRPL